MRHHRFAITWAVIGVIVAAAFAGAVLILNATVYSASGFAGSYLAALSRHDVRAAIELAGEPKPANEAQPQRDLLDARALARLQKVEQVSDTDLGDGIHRVSFRYELVSRDGARSVPGTTTFAVTRDGTHLGLFSAWRFVESPIGTIAITPEHDSGFTVNGFQLSSTGPSVATRQWVLVPGLYVLGHESDYFTAKPVAAALEKAGGASQATVDVQANATFVEQVQKGLDGQLAECAKQKVLLPTGCPFGKQVRDRIEGTPTWSIKSSPHIAIAPGRTPGTWTVPQAPGVAHLSVTVRSIFDGSVSTLDEDVPFTVSYAIGFADDGQLVITGQ